MTETEIQELDEDTVARIAAGEVVERPASAVKELVENSLDADATRIDVTVEAGGTDLIRVADDGHGMSEADVRAAVRQHTTSKIESVEDLDSGVSTLGFRGEALHTIGSVSRLTVQSRPRNGGGAGTELVYEGGEIVSIGPTGCPEGTTIEIADLFYNTPARRKFLKTTATEFAHVNRVVTRYALANPSVAVSLTHDGREVFATTGQGDLQAAVLSVYGREVATAMIDVDAEGEQTNDGDLPPGPLESVTGLVSHPETNRSSPEYLSTYVNGRAITSSAIREGIMGAYDGQLGDRYPFVVCFLDAPGDAVDVNVHPRKREVRFDDDDAVRRQVDAAVEGALLEHGLVRSSAPRGRSAPAETRVEPERESESLSDAVPDGTTEPEPEPEPEPESAEGPGAAEVEVEAEVEVDTQTEDSSPASEPESESNPTATRVEETESRREHVATSDSISRSQPTADRTDDSGASAKAEAKTETETRPETDEGDDSSRRNASESAGPETEGGIETGAEAEVEVGVETETAEQRSARQNRQRRTETERKFTEATEQRTLTGEEATTDAEFDSLPPLRVLGQLHDTYVVCETPDGLALVDQHAADERVNYERLQEAFAADPSAQALASPVELELTAAEAEAFEHYREALSRLGFYADRVDDRTVAVTTVPAVLEKTLEPDRLRDVLASFVSGDRESGAETVDALADEFLGDLACYPSVTGNTSLTEGSVVDLLRALDDCENPYACPHGRPVIVSIDGRELEDRFERDYPGHGG
ncbi:DNA mismatch repair endonuclease MutL [Natronoglomus mannanivorans]|uniref:DNA mismatch repair protein MutL n=1 Tax=Natronoglomus mannanivorans TaxID=2979990 RepID=A0AAP3E3T1_9EURY|nr:DNA mismatch repair endonuclease MutL [Halobacteria archaeon AArc-xg1-1]